MGLCETSNFSFFTFINASDLKFRTRSYSSCVYCMMRFKGSNGKVCKMMILELHWHFYPSNMGALIHLSLPYVVRSKIGPFASPDVIQSAPGLPKTRSGKIMRRVLRKVAKNDRDIGDVSTMADSNVVESLFANRPQVDFILN